MAFRRSSSRRSYAPRRSGYGVRSSSRRSGYRAAPRRRGTRSRARAGGTVRIVIAQEAANPVARPFIGMAPAPSPRKAKF